LDLGRLAQLIEQVLYTDKVAGLSPAFPTKSLFFDKYNFGGERIRLIIGFYIACSGWSKMVHFNNRLKNKRRR